MMTNLTWWILTLSFVKISYASPDNIGIVYGEDVGSKNSSSFCVMFNPKFSALPEKLDNADVYEVGNYSESFVCNDTLVDPADMRGRVAFVSRGNCSFSEKAFMVQKFGAKALVVISDSGISEPVASEDADYDLINISVSLMDRDDFNKLMNLGPDVRVQLFSPPNPRIDWNLVVIWLLATGTVFCGAYWAGIVRHDKYINRRRPSKRVGGSRGRDGNADQDSEDEDEDDNFDLSPTAILVFVVLMCGMLVSLYFFYDYLVYVVIGMFALACSIALYSTIKPIVLKMTCIGLCRVPPNKLPLLRQQPEVRMVILYLLCVGVCVFWVVVRNQRYAWILQDVLGVLFCVHMMKTIRLPSLMACTILLSLLFFYDIFFVFITPLFTKSGESIMVDVATGGSSKSGEMLPMVLKVPRITQSAMSVCQLPFSLLGFGDIMIPGLLVSYCHGFDLKVNSKKVYFITNVIAYGVGLILTFIALAMMESGQPALLYLVPCTLLTTVLVGACRRELRHLWTGKLIMKAIPRHIPDGPAGNGEINQSQSNNTDDLGAGSAPEGNEISSDESDYEQPLLVNK